MKEPIHDKCANLRSIVSPHKCHQNPTIFLKSPNIFFNLPNIFLLIQELLWAHKYATMCVNNPSSTLTVFQLLLCSCLQLSGYPAPVKGTATLTICAIHAKKKSFLTMYLFLTEPFSGFQLSDHSAPLLLWKKHQTHFMMYISEMQKSDFQLQLCVAVLSWQATLSTEFNTVQSPSANSPSYLNQEVSVCPSNQLYWWAWNEINCFRRNL